MSSTVAGILLKGVAGSRPAANAVSAGTIYSATDTGAITQSDGVSTWSTFATVGSGFTNPMTTTGDIIYSSSGSTPARLAVGAAGTVLKGGTTPAYSTAGEFATGNAKVATAQTTTSTSFADLATTGPSVTVTVGASGKVLLHIKSRMQNSAADDCYVGVDISGATTTAAATMLAISLAAGKLSELGSTTMITGLAAGSTTFKMQYAVASGTGTFTNRELTVAPVL